MPTNHFRMGLSRYFTPCQLGILENSHIGIAGLGGLGSNLALLLARSGIGNFTLIDRDVVDWSNLNRQQYWPRHVGREKTEALADLLLELNPDIRISSHTIELTAKNFPVLAEDCPVWAEALDDAAAKAMFIGVMASHADFFVCASGICGIGGAPINKNVFSRFHLIGDGKSDMRLTPPFAPRVAQAAAMMADSLLEYLLGDCLPRKLNA